MKFHLTRQTGMSTAHFRARLYIKQPSLVSAQFMSVKSSAAACPTELPDHTSYIREGWMYKRGGSHGGRTNWKRRWFALRPSEEGGWEMA